MLTHMSFNAYDDRYLKIYASFVSVFTFWKVENRYNYAKYFRLDYRCWKNVVSS